MSTKSGKSKSTKRKRSVGSAATTTDSDDDSKTHRQSPKRRRSASPPASPPVSASASAPAPPGKSGFVAKLSQTHAVAIEETAKAAAAVFNHGDRPESKRPQLSPLSRIAVDTPTGQDTAPLERLPAPKAPLAPDLSLARQPAADLDLLTHAQAAPAEVVAAVVAAAQTPDHPDEPVPAPAQVPGPMHATAQIAAVQQEVVAVDATASTAAPAPAVIAALTHEVPAETAPIPLPAAATAAAAAEMVAEAAAPSGFNDRDAVPDAAEHAKPTGSSLPRRRRGESKRTGSPDHAYMSLDQTTSGQQRGLPVTTDHRDPAFLDPLSADDEEQDDEVKQAFGTSFFVRKLLQSLAILVFVCYGLVLVSEFDRAANAQYAFERLEAANDVLQCGKQFLTSFHRPIVPTEEYKHLSQNPVEHSLVTSTIAKMCFNAGSSAMVLTPAPLVVRTPEVVDELEIIGKGTQPAKKDSPAAATLRHAACYSIAYYTAQLYNHQFSLKHAAVFDTISVCGQPSFREQQLASVRVRLWSLVQDVQVVAADFA